MPEKCDFIGEMCKLLRANVFLSVTNPCNFTLRAFATRGINMMRIKCNIAIFRAKVSPPNIILNQMNGYKTAQGQKLYLENRLA